VDFASVGSWAFWLLTALAAYLGSYAAEKGKRRARREDKDQILAELAKTTQIVKEIETRTTGELSHRQWRRDQAIRLYNELLRSMVEYRLCLMDLADARRFGTGRTTDIKFEQVSGSSSAPIQSLPCFYLRNALRRSKRYTGASIIIRRSMMIDTGSWPINRLAILPKHERN
jgi:hypothetical protein